MHVEHVQDEYNEVFKHIYFVKGYLSFNNIEIVRAQTTRQFSIMRKIQNSSQSKAREKDSSDFGK